MYSLMYTCPITERRDMYCVFHAIQYVYICTIAVHYLTSFYCDRLRDRVEVLPYVLCGLHAMVSILIGRIKPSLWYEVVKACSLFCYILVM